MDKDYTKFTCKKCKGRGRITSGQFYYNCPECDGKGYLDWIENIVGKRNIIEDFRSEIVSKMAKQMAEDIDREILESMGLTKEMLKNDNRSFSEFMLLDPIKQKESSKKDKNTVQRFASSTKFL